MLIAADSGQTLDRRRGPAVSTDTEVYCWRSMTSSPAAHQSAVPCRPWTQTWWFKDKLIPKYQNSHYLWSRKGATDMPVGHSNLGHNSKTQVSGAVMSLYINVMMRTRMNWQFILLKLQFYRPWLQWPSFILLIIHKTAEKKHRCQCATLFTLWTADEHDGFVVPANES